MTKGCGCSYVAQRDNRALAPRRGRHGGGYIEKRKPAQFAESGGTAIYPLDKFRRRAPGVGTALFENNVRDALATGRENQQIPIRTRISMGDPYDNL